MSDERHLMARLSAAVHRPAVRAQLLEMAARLRRELEASPALKSTQADVPLSIYDGDLGPMIGSSWVFVLRARHDHPAERHPNSIQRMFALDSPGAMEVWDGKRWRRHDLLPDPGDPGLSIPAYCWHRPARLDDVWAVVSFHTVPPAELIEEIGDPVSGTTQGSRHYLG